MCDGKIQDVKFKIIEHVNGWRSMEDYENMTFQMTYKQQPSSFRTQNHMYGCKIHRILVRTVFFCYVYFPFLLFMEEILHQLGALGIYVLNNCIFAISTNPSYLAFRI